MPGGGYFYTGHPVLGLFDAVVEGFLLLVVLGTLLLVLGGDPAGRWPDVWIFSAILAVEKLITIYHAFHYIGELLPADRSFRPAEPRFGPT